MGWLEASCFLFGVRGNRPWEQLGAGHPPYPSSPARPDTAAPGAPADLCKPGAGRREERRQAEQPGVFVPIHPWGLFMR